MGTLVEVDREKIDSESILPERRENSDVEIDRDKIDSQLKGKTLRVYWYILTSAEGSVGIREVQRALGFSSPALAQYHLEKLRELGLVRKQSGVYRLATQIKVGVLRQFLRFGSVIVPRFVLYAVLFTVLLGFLFLIIVEVNLLAVYAFVLGASGTAIFWYETMRAMRERPIEPKPAKPVSTITEDESAQVDTEPPATEGE